MSTLFISHVYFAHANDREFASVYILCISNGLYGFPCNLGMQTLKQDLFSELVSTFFSFVRETILYHPRKPPASWTGNVVDLGHYITRANPRLLGPGNVVDLGH